MVSIINFFVLLKLKLIFEIQTYFFGHLTLRLHILNKSNQ